MSNSRFHNSGKSELSSSTIGFRFHASDEELEELQLDHDNAGDKRNETNLELKLKTALLTSESLDSAKTGEDKSEGIGDVRDHKQLLGKRSTSMDSNYESPFSNPIETWRKLNELKEKITKTVEEKISEMKIDRNVLGKSSRARLLSSKENSSISDSEDTSESSKVSDWKDAEDLSSASTKGSNDTSESLSCILVNAVENVKLELKNKEIESELRNRRSCEKVSEAINIKIAVPKSELQGRLFERSLNEGSIIEGIESGVEADENLDPTQMESFNILEEPALSPGDGSQTPPSGGNDVHFDWVSFFISLLISETYTFLLLIAFGFYVFVPMTDFVRGFFLCGLMVAFFERVRYYLKMEDSPLLQSKSLVAPDYKSLPPLKVPLYKPAKGVWINEYENDYDPKTYSVSQTVPSYLEIDKSIIKLSRSRSKIQKRATFDESEYKLNFVSQRTYNIYGCSIYLLPEGLTRKRLFSKKYPIVIYLKPDSFISEKKKGKEVEEKESSEILEEDSFISTPELPKNRTSLCVFARCDRQKEEWYRRLMAATRIPSSPLNNKNGKIPEEVAEDAESTDQSPTKEPSTPFENLFFDDEAVYMEEYLRHMSKIIDIEVNHQEAKTFKPRSSWYKKLKTRKKAVDLPVSEEDVESVKNLSTCKKAKSSRTSVDAEGLEEEHEHEDPFVQVQWFNAFINRILFDVFRSPYWLSKLQDKVERKLNSIRLPYYIEDIEVIEMDLGKTGPIFHRVSAPHLDDRGLWFHMDVTFEGFIKMTIQTHLNLIKLQKGLEDESVTTLSSEKPEKGKKKHKESKDLFSIKESRKEKSKESVHRKCWKFGKASLKRGSIEMDLKEKNSNCEESQDLDSGSFEESRLFDEFARFAEIAVEESLGADKHKELECVTQGSCSKVDDKFDKSRSPIYDSELEDSAESSDEDEEEEEDIPIQSHPEPEEQTPVTSTKRYPRNRRSSRRLFRVFENVAQSKYFKSVAQSKYIQKAIAGVSATKLRLTVEIKSCTGTLAVNIPPPPSDRFWYGFRDMPKLVFSVNPKIGDKSVKFVHIKNYLQKKFLHELKKVMVSPNMIDFVLPTSAPARSPSPVLFTTVDLDQETTSSEELHQPRAPGVVVE